MFDGEFVVGVTVIGNAATADDEMWVVNGDSWRTTALADALVEASRKVTVAVGTTVIWVVVCRVTGCCCKLATGRCSWRQPLAVSLSHDGAWISS